MKIKEKIIEIITRGEGQALWPLISPYLNTKSISNSELSELAMAIAIYEGKLEKMIKYLSVDNVPELPIKTNFDKGRRFFYLIYILSIKIGVQYILPYLENIECHSTQDFRLMGGINFFDLNLEKSTYWYEKAISQSQGEEINQLYHSHIYNNYLICLAYLGKEKEFYRFLLNNTSIFSSLYSKDIERMKIYIHILNEEFDTARNLFLNTFKFPIDFFEHRSLKILSLQALFFIKLGDLKVFENVFKLYYEEIKQLVLEAKLDTTRAIKSCQYLFSINKLSNDYMYELIQDEIKNFPIFDVSFDNCRPLKNQEILIGNNQNSNCIYSRIEEYCINGIRGIGFSKEVKFIYYLLRAGDLGMSFEELSFHMNGGIDLSGLMLVRDRVKQIALKVEKKFGLKIIRKNYRFFIDKSIRNTFYVSSLEHLSIKDNFSRSDFFIYYTISETTAKTLLKKLESDGYVCSSRVDNKLYYKKK